MALQHGVSSEFEFRDVQLKIRSVILVAVNLMLYILTINCNQHPFVSQSMVSHVLPIIFELGQVSSLNLRRVVTIK
jgi:hypothetical protein